MDVSVLMTPDFVQSLSSVLYSKVQTSEQIFIEFDPYVYFDNILEIMIYTLIKYRSRIISKNPNKVSVVIYSELQLSLKTKLNNNLAIADK